MNDIINELLRRTSPQNARDTHGHARNAEPQPRPQKQKVGSFFSSSPTPEKESAGV
jgi:hypothetical protein